MDFDEYLIMNLANGFMGSYVLYTACKINLFDSVKDSSLEELAGDLDVEVQSLQRIVRPLVTYGFLKTESSNDNTLRFSLTNAGSMLTRSAENSLYGYVLFACEESSALFHSMSEAMLKKCASKDLLENSQIFDRLEQNPEKFQSFNQMMQRVSMGVELDAFFEKCMDKNKAYKIVDVGGGTGTILSKFLLYAENSTGKILDLKQARNDANKKIAALNLTERMQFSEGNFFERITEKADFYILSRVLHDWDDEKAVKILKNVSAAMDEDSQLVILEGLMPEDINKGNTEMYLNDLQMWCFCGGRERTLKEFESMFEDAGLALTEVIPLTNRHSLYAIIVKKLMEEWTI